MAEARIAVVFAAHSACSLTCGRSRFSLRLPWPERLASLASSKRAGSVTFLPLSGPTDGLQQLAPQIKRLDGDGRVLLPRVLKKSEAHRTMVIFDGEKREYAWETFDKLRDRMAVAIFDDSNEKTNGIFFNKWLTKKGETWWWTRDTRFVNLVQTKEAPALHLAKPLQERHECKWHGGVHQLNKFDFTIVRTGAWKYNQTAG